MPMEPINDENSEKCFLDSGEVFKRKVTNVSSSEVGIVIINGVNQDMRRHRSNHFWVLFSSVVVFFFPDF